MTTSLPVDKLVETLNDLFGKFDDAADVSEALIDRFDSEQLQWETRFYYSSDSKWP